MKCLCRARFQSTQAFDDIHSALAQPQAKIDEHAALDNSANRNVKQAKTSKKSKGSAKLSKASTDSKDGVKTAQNLRVQGTIQKRQSSVLKGKEKGKEISQPLGKIKTPRKNLDDTSMSSPANRPAKVRRSDSDLAGSSKSSKVFDEAKIQSSESAQQTGKHIDSLQDSRPVNEKITAVETLKDLEKAKADGQEFIIGSPRGEKLSRETIHSGEMPRDLEAESPGFKAGSKSAESSQQIAAIINKQNLTHQDSGQSSPMQKERKHSDQGTKLANQSAKSERLDGVGRKDTVSKLDSPSVPEAIFASTWNHNERKLWPCFRFWYTCA